MNKIDTFLNTITMYKVVMYGLFILSIIGVLFGFLGFLPFTGVNMILSLVCLIFISYGINIVLSKLYHAPINAESSVITALILFLVLSPISKLSDIWILLLTGCIAMASKYVINLKKKHIFNPVAITLVLMSAFGSGIGIWWIGSKILLPFVLVVGLLIVRKTRRFTLFFSFLGAGILSIITFGILNGSTLSNIISQLFTSWPIIFFGTIMLTEPLTTPPTQKLRIIYGIIVGALFGAQFSVGPVFSGPALALVLGNIFSYLVSSQQKLMLSLKESRSISLGIYEFVFTSDERLHFYPGQYLEWTLPHDHVDTRGNRRYFTIASSPTEPEIRLGIRFMDKGASSFKNALVALKQGGVMTAGALAGDFTLPKDENKKMVWIAGGIGVTPFRSMTKYLSDTDKKRDVVLFYAAKEDAEIAYKDIFVEGSEKFGLKTVFVLSDLQKVPNGWTGKTGFVTADMIKSEVPNYEERMYYISGPNAMVMNYKKMLSTLGIQNSQIVTDYFPGF